MVKLYSKKWHRNPYEALLGYIRDLFIYFFPIKLPLFVIKILYGIKPDFIFLVHPRRSEDIFRALPFFTLLRRIITKRAIIKVFSYCPPCTIAIIRAPKGINGLVISSFYLPDVLLRKTKIALKESYRCIKLSSKVTKKNSYVGLGALWPIATRRGLAINKYANKKNLMITNGHTGTIISLTFMVDRLSELLKLNKENLKVIVIGAGKMGSNLSKVLLDKIKYLGLVDINKKRLDRLEEELRKRSNTLIIDKILRSSNTDLKKILNNYHFGICVTSNARGILKVEDIPDNFIIIDDSRPEAIPRDDILPHKIILEGGLIKIENLNTDYDYGFGIDNNVFGCLAETYALVLDRNSTLKPTIGNIEIENYHKMYRYFVNAKLDLGDFKSGDKRIPENKIKEILKERMRLVEQNV